SILLFFFSSRRRHTRWPRDWSSDVCSSDLELSAVLPIGLEEHPRRESTGLPGGDQGVEEVSIRVHQRRQYPVQRFVEYSRIRHRSEERRVGKECKCRRGRWQ